MTPEELAAFKARVIAKMQLASQRATVCDTARCRWCDNNNVPLEKMAIYSFKPWFGGFTGVCKECLESPEAEARYHERMLKLGEHLEPPTE